MFTYGIQTVGVVGVPVGPFGNRSACGREEYSGEVGTQAPLTLKLGLQREGMLIHTAQGLIIKFVPHQHPSSNSVLRFKDI